MERIVLLLEVAQLVRVHLLRVHRVVGDVHPVAQGIQRPEGIAHLAGHLLEFLFHFRPAVAALLDGRLDQVRGDQVYNGLRVRVEHGVKEPLCRGSVAPAPQQGDGRDDQHNDYRRHGGDADLLMLAAVLCPSSLGGHRLPLNHRRSRRGGRLQRRAASAAEGRSRLVLRSTFSTIHNHPS